MFKPISADINYDSAILAHVFKCKLCGSPLLMFGCNNKDCKNFHENNIFEKKEVKRNEE